MKNNHIKVDWETHQILLKYRDKLSCPMAGPTSQEAFIGTKADYKGQRALKSCHSEFHRILWCGIYKKGRIRFMVRLFFSLNGTDYFGANFFWVYRNRIVGQK